MILFPEHIVERTPLVHSNEILDSLVQRELKKTIPACELIKEEGLMISSSGKVFQKDGSLHRLSFSSDRTIDNKNILFRNQFKWAARKEKAKFEKRKLAGSYLWATDYFSANYFHWFCDVLPRILVLPEKYKKHPLLLPSKLRSNFILKSLESLGVEYVHLEEGRLYEVEDIVAASHTANTGNYNEEIINRLRKEIKTKISRNISRGNKIYISRSKARKRKVSNEAEVERTLIDHNYSIINFEDYTWLDQLSIISHADRIVGIHGAGLTNMLFAKEFSKILEFRKRGDNINNCFYSMASALNFPFSIVQGNFNPLTFDRRSPNITINVQKLHQILDAFA